MAKPYKRCKVCFKRRGVGFPISRTGLCFDCQLARQIEYAEKSNAALRAGVEQPPVQAPSIRVR